MPEGYEPRPFEGAFAEISLTTPSTPNTQVYVALPSGFTLSNSYIVGVKVTYNNNFHYVQDARFVVQYYNGGITVYATDSTFTSKACKILIMKYA